MNRHTIAVALAHGVRWGLILTLEAGLAAAVALVIWPPLWLITHLIR